MSDPSPDVCDPTDAGITPASTVEAIDFDWLLEQVYQRTYLELVEAGPGTIFH